MAKLTAKELETKLNEAKMHTSHLNETIIELQKELEQEKKKNNTISKAEYDGILKQLESERHNKEQYKRLYEEAKSKRERQKEISVSLNPYRMYQIDFFRPTIEDFNNKLVELIIERDKQVDYMSEEDKLEYIRLIKEVSQRIELAFHCISKDYLDVNKDMKIPDDKIYQNQIDALDSQMNKLKAKLARTNAGRPRASKTQDEIIVEMRNNKMTVKAIEENTGVSTATINRILRKYKSN